MRIPKRMNLRKQISEACGFHIMVEYIQRQAKVPGIWRLEVSAVIFHDILQIATKAYKA